MYSQTNLISEPDSQIYCTSRSTCTDGKVSKGVEGHRTFRTMTSAVKSCRASIAVCADFANADCSPREIHLMMYDITTDKHLYLMDLIFEFECVIQSYRPASSSSHSFHYPAFLFHRARSPLPSYPTQRPHRMLQQSLFETIHRVVFVVQKLSSPPPSAIHST